jgi:hypothetical protein
MTATKPTNPNDTKPTLTLAQSTIETKVNLKTICFDLKLDPRVAREKLRLAVRDVKNFPELAKAHKPRGTWEWTKGSSAEKEARLVLSQ